MCHAKYCYYNINIDSASDFCRTVRLNLLSSNLACLNCHYNYYIIGKPTLWTDQYSEINY